MKILYYIRRMTSPKRREMCTNVVYLVIMLNYNPSPYASFTILASCPSNATVISSSLAPTFTSPNAPAANRWAARRFPIKDISDSVNINRSGVRTKSTVCSRPSSNTNIPSSISILIASDANRITSPCVTSATVGIFFDTLGTFNSVFCTSDTNRSRPRPLILVSNFPLNYHID